MGERTTKVVGLWSQQMHPHGCQCEGCGPLLLIALSEYEANRLLDALNQRDGSDTGDWHGQIRQKLEQGLK